MANEEHLKILKQGVEQWNKWRLENAIFRPDLSGAKLSDAKLSGAKLSGADLSNANLSGANLIRTNLSDASVSGADLSCANLVGANLIRAKLSGVKLIGANLIGANLSGANLSGADLTDADLSRTSLVETDFTNATITGCRTYGASAWNVTLEGTIQDNLVITKEGEPVVTVDDLEVAQFIYLLLNREKLRNVIQTITSRAVLILGRFTPERKPFLDALAKEVRKHHLLPIIFDFERATTRDFTETIKVLAGMSVFVIADITNPRSAPLELQALVPDYQIPFVPIIQEGEKPFPMFRDLLGKYDWVLGPVITYSSLDKLTKGFKKGILDRAWTKNRELAKRKAATIEMQSIDDL